MNLTVVLPVHNAEATLRRDVIEVLDISGELISSESGSNKSSSGKGIAGVRVFIVDDGSTDDTYDMAVELAAKFPQIRVTRHAERQGLGPALEQLRRQVVGDFVLVHDGASPIDANQIRRLWMQQSRAPAVVDSDASIDDIRQASSVHASMAVAHSRLAGFQWISSAPATAQGNKALTRRDKKRKSGVGVIPPLPRPNFMGTLANFVLGE